MPAKPESQDVDKTLLEAAAEDLRRLATDWRGKCQQPEAETESRFSQLYANFRTRGLVRRGWGYYRCTATLLMRQR